MTAIAMQFEAKKHGYRQTQDGIVVSFVVHPNDVHADLAVAPLGTHYVVVVAPYTEDRPPSSTGSEHRDSTPAVGGSNPSADAKPEKKTGLAWEAKRTCADFRFQKWLGVADEPAAADRVRRLCRVASRGEFDRDPAAAALWDALVRRYREETGLVPEQRGLR